MGQWLQAAGWRVSDIACYALQCIQKCTTREFGVLFMCIPYERQPISVREGHIKLVLSSGW